MGYKDEKKPIKPHVNIGTIGHVDHGKTVLMSAISDTLKEGMIEDSEYPSKNDDGKRGITINVIESEREF